MISFPNFIFGISFLLGLDRPPTGLSSAPSVPSASVAGGLVNRAGSGSMTTVPMATVPSVASQTSRGGAHDLQNYVPYLADFRTWDWWQKPFKNSYMTLYSMSRGKCECSKSLTPISGCLPRPALRPLIWRAVRPLHEVENMVEKVFVGSCCEW